MALKRLTRRGEKLFIIRKRQTNMKDGELLEFALEHMPITTIRK